jgi:uncharacterized protein (DUF1499 family)
VAPRFAPLGLALALLLLGAACGGTRPEDLGEVSGLLRTCPGSPNCVSSDARDDDHRVEPIAIVGAPDAAFARARQVVADWPRTELVRDEAGYLHAECKSRLLRFVDDLELSLRADRGEIAVRSASRLGYSDLGVNRDRIERLRDELVAAGVAAPAPPRD